MTESSDENGKFGCRDGAWIVFVEHWEKLLVVNEFLFAQIFESCSFHGIFYIEYYYTILNPN